MVHIAGVSTAKIQEVRVVESGQMQTSCGIGGCREAACHHEEIAMRSRHCHASIQGPVSVSLVDLGSGAGSGKLEHCELRLQTNDDPHL